MKKLEELNKVIKSEQKNEINPIKHWKSVLIEKINGNRDIYLFYKVEYKKITSYSDLNLGISVITLFFAVLGILLSNSSDIQNYNINLNQGTTTLTGKIEAVANSNILDCIPILLLVGYILLLAFFVIRFIRKVNTYRVAGVVLDEIDKNWESIYKTKHD